MSDLEERLACGRGAAHFLLTMIGEDCDRDGLKDTPERFARAYMEMTAGYEQHPSDILSTTFDVEYDEMVIVRGIGFHSLCEHHMLPFSGVAHVGYLPGAKVVGLSKVVRLVHCFAQRLQIQERMTMQIAESMQAHLKPRGVGVVVQAHHSCMSCRGVRADATMVTSALLGHTRTEGRAEFLKLCGV